MVHTPVDPAAAEQQQALARVDLEGRVMQKRAEDLAEVVAVDQVQRDPLPRTGQAQPLLSCPREADHAEMRVRGSPGGGGGAHTFWDFGRDGRIGRVRP